ncbi:MAG: Do family serine endopeptidase [Parvularculales bacterium]
MLLFSVGVGIGSNVAQAQDQDIVQIPQSLGEIQLSFAPVARRAAPAVVNIYARRIVRRQEGLSPFSNPFFRQFFGNQLLWDAPRERVENSLGSGVIVNSDGVIVTNNHVVEGGESFVVVLADRRSFDATLVLADERSDLAVLKIDPDGEALPALSLGDANKLEVGDLVLAIGNPFGVGQTVTSGIISGLSRTHVGVADFRSFIQTDAAINPGNSGGALVNIRGELVGINTAIYSRSGGSDGIGFAIPVVMVQRIVHTALEGNRLARPWIGARLQSITRDLADTLALKQEAGALVTEIYKGGPADRAGLREGDVIVGIGDQDILNPDILRFHIATLEPGAPIEVDIIRGGEARSVNFPLEITPEQPLRNLVVLGGRTPLSGATVGNLSPALAEELGLDVFVRGVVVTYIERGSAAGRFGFQIGDIIVRLGDVDIDSVARLEETLAALPQEGWRLSLRRGGRTITTVIRG